MKPWSILTTSAHKMRLLIQSKVNDVIIQDLVEMLKKTSKPLVSQETTGGVYKDNLILQYKDKV